MLGGNETFPLFPLFPSFLLLNEIATHRRKKTKKSDDHGCPFFFQADLAISNGKSPIYILDALLSLSISIVIHSLTHLGTALLKMGK